MKIKYLLSCSLLAGSALFASCTSIEPKLDNDYKPLLPEEIPEGTITQLNYGELRAFPGADGHGRDGGPPSGMYLGHRHRRLPMTVHGRLYHHDRR